MCLKPIQVHIMKKKRTHPFDVFVRDGWIQTVQIVDAIHNFTYSNKNENLPSAGNIVVDGPHTNRIESITFGVLLQI